MRIFTYLLIVIVLALGGYGTFFYITEFKPLNYKVVSLNEENRTLTELIMRLKKQMEAKVDSETGDSYKKSILEELSKISAEENFEIRRAEKGVEISLPGLRLFNPGEADLSSEGLLILSKLGKILKNATTGEIHIEGHTDDMKISGDLLLKYPSNWELSSARAINVVRFLQEKVEIPPERLAAVAYGQYQPLFPNDSEVHRHKNRRIVMVIEAPREMKEKGKEEEKEKGEEKVEPKKEEKKASVKIEKKAEPEPEPGEEEGENEEGK